MALLEVHELTVETRGRYNRSLLSGINLDIGAGEIVGIGGPSGAGKTMLALAIMGLLPPSLRVANGTISLEGNPLANSIHDRAQGIVGQKLAMLFQEPRRNFNPLHPVGPQISAPLTQSRNHSHNEADIIEIVSTSLDELGMHGREQIYSALPGELSTGQLQRCLLVSILICPPRLFIADEPTSALDSESQDFAIKCLQRLNTIHGTAIMLISHDYNLLDRLSVRRVIVDSGRLTESTKIQDTDIGRRPDNMPDLLEARPILEVSGLKKSFATGVNERKIVLDHVNLSIRPGQAICVAGSSGCGKTTLARALMNIAPAECGSVLIDGDPVSRDTPQKIVRRGMSMIWQDAISGLNPRRSVGDQIEDAIGASHSQQQRSEALRRVIDCALLPKELLSHRPHELSGGQCQRALIARALAAAPRALIADEPVAYIDEVTKVQIIGNLLRVCVESLMALLIFSHETRIMRSFGIPIANLAGGKILLEERTGK